MKAIAFALWYLCCCFEIAAAQRSADIVKYPVVQAARRANEYWAAQGFAPACQGVVNLLWTWDQPSWVDAEATWSNQGDSAPFACSVRFNANHFDPLFLADWPHFCTAATHEFGHLHGKDHVDDPTNVMYTSPTPYNEPPQCKPAPDVVRAQIRNRRNRTR